MTSFGLVTEGITDQIVIENILYGFFDNKNLIIKELQPTRDATDENRATTHANWDKVFEYCKSIAFQQAFEQTEYVIVHLDTDVFAGENVPPDKQIPQGLSTTAEKVEWLKDRLIKAIGPDFYAKVKERIVFAISVDSIECWILPLYYSDSKASKETNCLETLNRELAKKEGFTIDAKNPGYYRTASKGWQKKKTVTKKSDKQPSLAIFLDELPSREAVIPEQEDW